MRGVWFGREFINVAATNPDWEKWRPRNPTSAHWYDEQRLQRYLAAHVARDRDLGQSRTVREFIAEFRGLSGTARPAQDPRRGRLLASIAGRLLRRRSGQPRAALPSCWRRCSGTASRSPRKHLGIIGAEHFKERFLAAGGAVDTFKYQCRKGIDADGIPYVVEFCFRAASGRARKAARVPREFVTGANWSAAISNPFRRFGSTGEGLESTLAKVRANASQPVICALHLASARIQFADRGKSSIILDDDAEQPDD